MEMMENKKDYNKLALEMHEAKKGKLGVFSKVKVETKLLDNILEISVSDEGCGIDENKDIFAPFKRYGKAGGSGLGLFVAKNAANAMGAQISVLNRDDGKSGAVARLLLKIS